VAIGLYFGSFNPIHIGHLIIAQYVLQHSALQKIWFVVSPHNPLKNSSDLLDEYKRFRLVQTAVEDNVQFKAVDIEFKLPRPSYTVNTLTYLKEKYPTEEFAIIMGGDSYQNLPRWKNFEYIINNHKLLVYERPGSVVTIIPNSQTALIQAPSLNISATAIRQLIKDKKSIKYLVTPAVEQEIESGGYYKV
jgi:nicotinate-nucleotide adenylyltransferase